MNKILTLILTFIFSVCAFSQVLSNTEPGIDNLPREKSSVLSNKWEVIPSIKVIPPSKFKGNKTEIHHQTKDHVFVYRNRDKTKPLLLLENENESHVIYNSDRKTSSLISGVLLLNLNNISDVDKLVKAYPIVKIKTFDQTGLAIVKTKVGFDIAKVFSDLKQDSRVRKIEIEMMPTVQNELH